MTKKIIMSASFLLAVAGAFASQILAPEPGYSSKDVIEDQVLQCEEIELCENAGGPLCVSSAPVIKNGVLIPAGTQLFKFEAADCEVPLTRQ